MEDNNFPIMFHYFHNNISKKYGQGSISDKKILDTINKIGRDNILDIDIWLEKYNTNTLGKYETCFTIDDGLKCQYNVLLPILKKFNIKAGWFIYTNPIDNKSEIIDIYKYFCGIYYNNYNEFYKDFFILIDNKLFHEIKIKFIESKYLNNVKFYSYNDRLFRYIRDIILSKQEFKNLILKMIKLKNVNINNLIKNIWMTEDDIKELSKTQLIGLHSTSHPTRMDLVDAKQQYEEYNNCKVRLEKLINKKIYILSYPCGRYNKDTFEILKKIDIEYAFIAKIEEEVLYKNYLISRKDSCKLL